ncbi:unannotated protein [freshwater metagenome]|uniref:Unannotated protein n=1 Tax=freshwater metagenome TaxID=449393 RepID=A0A6J7A4I3_9ZZZZ
MIPSCAVDVSRSRVTGPPIRIPAIQCGRGMTGNVRIFRPGIGTPISTPVRTRMAMTHKPILSDHEKLAAQGVSSALFLTTIAVTPTTAMAIEIELVMATAVAIAPAQIHHTSGCNERFIETIS